MNDNVNDPGNGCCCRYTCVAQGSRCFSALHEWHTSGLLMCTHHLEIVSSWCSFDEHHFCNVLLEHFCFYVFRKYVSDVLLAADLLHLQLMCSHNSCVSVCRVFPTSRLLTTPSRALASVMSTMSNVIPTFAAKLFSPMPSAAILLMAYNYASHDDSALR